MTTADRRRPLCDDHAANLRRKKLSDDNPYRPVPGQDDCCSGCAKASVVLLPETFRHERDRHCLRNGRER